MQNQLKVSLENIIPLTEARDHFSQIVNEVQKDKLYVLTKGGKPAVAIIDVKYLEHITGGEVNKEDIKEEIKKSPEKVGLPPMIEHEPPKPTPPSPPSTNFDFPKPEPKPEPEIKPAPPMPEPKPTPPIPQPIPKPTPPINSNAQTNIPPKPLVTPPIPEVPPKPAGFAAPAPVPPINVPKPEPIKPTPSNPAPLNPVVTYSPSMPPLETMPTPTPATPSQPMPTPLKTPPDEGQTIDIQERDNKPSDENSRKDKMTSLDDKSSPAQYAGSSEEPEDMSID